MQPTISPRHHTLIGKRWARNRGSAVIEFALSAPLLFAMLGAVMDFSNSFYVATAVANAAEAGANFGVLNAANQSNYTGMQTAATGSQPYVSGMTASASQYCESTSNAAIPCTTTGQTTRMFVKVSTRAPYSVLAGYIDLPTSVSASAVAYRRYQ